MNLYFNGCSFTFGDELQDPKNSAWPALVADSLKCQFLNDAVSGGSNDRIVYKTLLASGNYDYFFIAWTTYARFTEYNPVDNFEINFSPQLNLDPSLHFTNDLKTNYKKYKNYGELYYKHWFNELYQFKKWLQQIILLQSFLSVHKKKYLMLNTMCNNLHRWLQHADLFIVSTRDLIDFFDYVNDEQLLQEQKQIQQLVSLIDKSKFIGWNEWSITSLRTDYPCGPRGHILEDGHQAVAKKVLEYYNKTQ
jgi:hypothetical protein